MKRKIKFTIDDLDKERRLVEIIPQDIKGNRDND